MLQRAIISMVEYVQLILELLHMISNAMSKFIYKNVHCRLVIIEKLEVTKEEVGDAHDKVKPFASTSSRSSQPGPTRPKNPLFTPGPTGQPPQLTHRSQYFL